MVLILNIFWFYLILDGLKRMLQEAGVLKKTETKEPSILEKYEDKAKLTGKKEI